MRKFNVNVNGNMYSVEVEEVEAGAYSAPAAPVAAAPAPVAAAPQAAPKAAAKPVVSEALRLIPRCPGPCLSWRLPTARLLLKAKITCARSHENGKRYQRQCRRRSHLYRQRGRQR